MQMFLLVICIVIFECATSLDLISLNVPSHVSLGVRATLSCRWHLGPGDVLYSVKWYKDGREFFRHVPRDVKLQRKFHLPGVDVEEYNESGSQIVLKPADLDTRGRYRCEVSGEGPLFPTVSEHADMTVVILPENGPTLSGFQSGYRLGDRVKINCTSGKSLPPMHLTWYLNGEQLPDPAQTHRLENGLFTTHVSLDFVIHVMHFKNNLLKVKCLGTISPIYWRSIEETADFDRNELQFYDKRNREVLKVGQTNSCSKNALMFYFISCNLVLAMFT